MNMDPGLDVRDKCPDLLKEEHPLINAQYVKQPVYVCDHVSFVSDRPGERGWRCALLCHVTGTTLVKGCVLKQEPFLEHDAMAVSVCVGYA